MTTQNSNQLSTIEFVKTAGLILGCVIFVCSVPFIWSAMRDFSLSMTQQGEVNWVLSHAYPNSRLARVDGTIENWPAGSTASVSVWVTFDSSDSFDLIKAWYVQHPEGGRDGDEGDNFPQNGLEELSNNSSGLTSYSVSYFDTTDCGFPLGDCDRPMQQLR